jgi:hypothetical protein
MPATTKFTFPQFANCYVPFAILMTVALLAPEATQNLDRYRTIYTIWATILLLIPTFCFYIFSDAGEAVFNYWRLMWTFSYLAFLFHFYWAVFIIYKGIPGVFHGQGILKASINFLLTTWWGVDVLLSWLVPSSPFWLRLERGLSHTFVFVIFVLTTLTLRPSPVNKGLGVALLSVVAVAFIVWLIVREPGPQGSALPKQ